MNNLSPKVGVGIIVFKEINNRPHIMLHQRKGSHGKDFWGSGGGHLEHGESLMAGALRELAEEAGDEMVVSDVTFLGVMNFTQMQPKHYVDVSFSAQWVSGDPVNSSPRETTDWQWFELSELPSPLFPPVEIYLSAAQSGERFFDSAFTAI